MSIARNKRSAKQSSLAYQMRQRQAETVRLGLQGLSQTEIARQLGISQSTVRNDYKAVLQAADDRRKELGSLLLAEHLRAIEGHINLLVQQLKARIQDDPAQPVKTVSLDTLLDIHKELRNWYAERAKLLNLYPANTSAQEVNVTITEFRMDFGTGTHAQEDMLPLETVQGKAAQRTLDAGHASTDDGEDDERSG